MKINQNLQTFFNFFKSKKPYIYVAIGDSVAQGTGASLQEKSYTSILYAHVKKEKKNAMYLNFARHGAPTKQILEEQLQQVISLNPDLVTISVGANDIRLRTTPGVFKKNLETIFATIRERTNAQIVMNTIPDFSHAPKIPLLFRQVSKIAIRHYNEIIINVAKFHDVACVDLFDQGTYYVDHFPEAIAEDGFHPSDIGHAIWAQYLLGEIRLIINSSKPRFSF